jgi:hypothetical protein
VRLPREPGNDPRITRPEIWKIAEPGRAKPCPRESQGEKLAPIAIPTATTTTTTRPLFTRPRLIDCQSPPLKVLLMEHGDGLARVVLGRHLNESKSAGSARSAVLHNIDCQHSPCLSEVILQIVFSCCER